MTKQEQAHIDNETLSLKLFVVLTRALESVSKRATEDIRALGLNPTEFAVLEFIYNRGDQPIQKIGAKVLISSSSITYVVDKLEKKQLLRRKPCAKDRRITYASLTEAGKELMDELFPQHKRALTEIFAGLDEREKETAIDLLKKLGKYAEMM